MRPPFEVLSCSWPRPVAHDDGIWTSPPEWDSPGLPFLPEPELVAIGDEVAWQFDWCAILTRGFVGKGREYRGFHLILRLRAGAAGRLAFYADDGCVIRRNGDVVHDDRAARSFARGEIDVAAGDLLEVAHWQLYGHWKWAAFLDSRPFTPRRSVETLLAYLPRVQERLRAPNGPPLKMFTNAAAPARAVLAIYSMVLNGYSPSQVLLYGSHQWSGSAWRVLTTAMPFARVVHASEVCAAVEAAGGQTMMTWAERSWVVMKTATLVLTAPSAFCAIDDDVVVLDRVDDALEAFTANDLVYVQDMDNERAFADAWGGAIPRLPRPLPTRTFNAGLYWLRRYHDQRLLVEWAQRVDPASVSDGWVWEMGLIASAFAAGTTHALSTQRYLLPMLDGLPGGIAGYDYRANPCGFAAIHYCGIFPKPSDREALLMLPDVLGDPATP